MLNLSYAYISLALVPSSKEHGPTPYVYMSLDSDAAPGAPLLRLELP